MAKKPLVSVIVIDYKKVNPYLDQCFLNIKKQSYKNFEILFYTDYKGDRDFPGVTKKFYGHYVGPAQKRDDAARAAKGEILAFLDDDAYPTQDWLENMINDFVDPQIVAVGGPGITPPEVSWQEEASGWVSASPLGAGSYVYRFLPGRKQLVDDYPSMNLAVRRNDFLEVGGFDSNYWPGEDTKLCLDLVNKLKKKIIYDPKIAVYHHRRPLWMPHLRQNGNFGLHRGFFARILPQTSFRPIYFGPSFMFLGLIYLLITLFVPSAEIHLLSSIGWTLLAIYCLALIFNGLWVYKESRKLFQGVLAIITVFATHVWYGLRFLQGFFFTRSLKR